MLGLAKWFVIFIFLSLAVGYGTKNWMNAVNIMIMFIIIKVIWRFATR